jgi:hypothetical protein
MTMNDFDWNDYLVDLQDGGSVFDAADDVAGEREFNEEPGYTALCYAT